MVKSKKWEVSPMCECCSSSAHVHTDTLKVEGLSCSHCQAAIEKAVGGLRGVEKVAVNLEAKEVKVEYNPDLITLDAIKNTIIEEGYQVKE